MPGNTDRQELVSSTVFQLAGLYSILVASLLTVFIQQDCGSTVCVGSGAAQVCTTQKQACSFSENLGVTSRFGKLVVAFNFVTLGIFLVSNIVFWFRERWIIQHFDTDNDLPIDNLTFGAHAPANRAASSLTCPIAQRSSCTLASVLCWVATTRRQRG